MIKFKNNLSNYKYLLSFDLAKNISGYSLLDIKNDKILLAGTINTGKTPNGCLIWDYFYNQVKEIINTSLKITGSKGDDLFVAKEQLPVQNGRFSTIATLQSLAQVHAVFDLAIYNMGVSTYDEVGIHSVAVKAYFRRLLNIQAPQKEDIAKYIYGRYSDYDFSNTTLDVTDSIGVSLTLIYKKWNDDIHTEVTQLKKELKSAKAQSKITRLQEEISKLENLRSDIEIK